MAWIEIPSPQSDPHVADAVAAVAGKRGTVANILAVHGVHPASMVAHMRLYVELMFSRSELTRAERETIAVVVSRANACTYCVAHHVAPLRALLRDDALVDSIAAAPEAAPLPARARALVDYALKLTRTPAAVTVDDVRPLREAGIGDRGIHDAAAVTAYFNFVNRVALGLGVELEPDAWNVEAPPPDYR